MTVLPQIALKATNYKCIGTEPMGFDVVRPVNILVGRNNSGKSALIDLVSIVCDRRDIPIQLHHNRVVPKILATFELTETDLKQAFRPDSFYQQGRQRLNAWTIGQQFIGSTITFELSQKNGFQPAHVNHPSFQEFRSMFGQVDKTRFRLFEDKSFHRLLADRDVGPEVDQDAAAIAENGRGFTNVVQRLLNMADLPSELVEDELLAGLNEIFGTDAHFTRVEIQKHNTGLWEVFLRENHKGLIALSNSGSGLKTVLLVLGFIVLLPFLQKRPLSQFIFAFEELENNLHPALQRRLAQFVRKKCVEEGCIAFLTTHSSAIIDLLSHDESTQILRVSHGGKTAIVHPVTTYVHNRGVLDDLDVRASDLLQSNGIVWVEGPSDRLYINRWVTLASNGKLSEGAHYQCVFYGGRLLAHLSGKAPFDAVPTDEAVKILAVNRNAAIVIDSDRRSAADAINNTKQQIYAAINQLGGMVWITQGREIENYLSKNVIAKTFQVDAPTSQFGDIGEILEAVIVGLGNRFRRDKVLYAEVAAENTEAEDLNTLDLATKVRELCSQIAKWNGLEVIW